MTTKNPDKSITITLAPDFAQALRHFRQEDPRHMSIVEQVRRALICYWIKQDTPEGYAATEMVLPGYEPGDEQFTIVREPTAGEVDDEQ